MMANGYYFWLGADAEAYDIRQQMADWLKAAVKPPHNIRLPVRNG